MPRLSPATVGRRLLPSVCAAFVATCVLSAIMVTTGAWLIEPDIIGLLARLAGQITPPYEDAGRPTGWLAHFFTGTVLWGVLFAAWDGWLRRWPYYVKGVMFGVIAWFLMIALFLPPLGYGITQSRIGIEVEVESLVLHLAYGLVLGWIYGVLLRTGLGREA